MRFLRYYLPWRVVKGPMSRRSEIICSLGVGNAVRAACRGAGPLASNPTDRSSQMTGMRPLVHHGGGCYETNGLSVRRLFCAMTATCRFAQIGKRHPVCRRRRCLFGRWLGRRRFDRHRFFSRRFGFALRCSARRRTQGPPRERDLRLIQALPSAAFATAHRVTIQPTWLNANAFIRACG